MSDSSKKKSAARTSSRSSSSAGNVSPGNRELLSRADVATQLQASPGPVTSTKDARSWLEAKSWILAGEKYTKPKLANILFTIALTQKLTSEASAAIKAVAFLIEDLADQDFSDSLASLITDKVTSQISSSIDNLVEALSGFDARKRNTNQRYRELTRIGPVQKLRRRCIGKSSEIREGSGTRERER